MSLNSTGDTIAIGNSSTNTVNIYNYNGITHKNMNAITRILKVLELDNRKIINRKKDKEDEIVGPKEILFIIGNSTITQVYNYNTNILIKSKINISSFDVYINNNYYGTDLNEIPINNQDDLKIVIIKTNESLESKFLYETTLTISDQLQSKMSIDGSPGLKTFLIDDAIISEFEDFSITPWTSIIYSEDKINTYSLLFSNCNTNATGQ
jgi:hypothetical protein